MLKNKNIRKIDMYSLSFLTTMSLIFRNCSTKCVKILKNAEVKELPKLQLYFVTICTGVLTKFLCNYEYL